MGKKLSNIKDSVVTVGLLMAAFAASLLFLRFDVEEHITTVVVFAVSYILSYLLNQLPIIKKYLV